ncbi:MAG: glycosyltransferase family 2 protein [Coriobacteriia bacterium]|nr:glycosyltransferase family 2 protein [Coriobacteriia bacterium]
MTTTVQPGRVSVVIPCYNQANYLPDAIESALNQTYHDVEVVVVNDGSPDDTSEVARRYPQVVLVEQENAGLSAARNAGIRAASGQYILPLDADDMIDSTYCEKAVPLFTTGVGIVRAYQQNFGDDNQAYALPEVKTVYDILPRNAICCASMFRRDLWEKVGGFDENMKSGYEDWEFWIRILAKKKQVRTIPEVLFYYRKHGRSMVDDAVEQHWDIFEYITTKHRRLYRDIGMMK